MVRVLLLNPGRWGRGITPIWVASHSASLKSRGHEVELFDATFFKDWAQHENAFNTANQQYKPSAYEQMVTFFDTPVREAFQAKLDASRPDLVFWAALSSHIHGEGEYAAIQNGYELITSIKTNAVTVSGGLQPSADAAATAARFPAIDMLIGGESELVLADVADAVGRGNGLDEIAGLIRRNGDSTIVAPRQPIISDMDVIGHYDYSLFDDQVFLRPYNGEVVRAVDYELSRGCPFTCAYCVETVIQKYYGFTEATPRGALREVKSYLRHKSAARIFAEIYDLYSSHGVTLFRCQDTNFLTIDRKTLKDLADRFEEADLPIKLYIETRPEGINAGTIPLMQKLRIDGVGMGIEMSTQSFRESLLNRFSDQEAILRAFDLMKEVGIKRTAYNIIGIPDQTEDSILETIDFNRRLNPDNVTVAFYSPYLGTQQQRVGAEKQYFLDYEFDLDSQLRTMSRHSVLSPDILAFYKRNFARLVREGRSVLSVMKQDAGLAA